VVLAQMGAPVRAASFSLSPMSVGASIRVLDSLQEGHSRFYAEILRLKHIVDLARANGGATMFLLDEVLSGTNSHDRRQGAEGLLRGLIGFGAVGLATTHDLALGDIAAGWSPQASNVHFADKFDGGSLAFDYVLREGPVKTSNALALMRSIGLDVDPA
jgi:DNA mismatch repair ATPase MutS